MFSIFNIFKKQICRNVVRSKFEINQTYLESWNCPMCNGYLGTYDMGYKYCPNCGQHLNWHPAND